MAKLHLGVLSFGVFLIIVAFWIAAWLLAIITPANIVPLILLSSGVWIIVVAGLKAMKPEGEGAFTNFGWGMLFIVLGGALYLVNNGMDPVYTVVFVLALIGALAVVAAVRSSRK